MTDSPQVHRIRSDDSSWEEEIGSSRAVAAGDRVIVAGIMPAPASGAVPGDAEPYEQTLSAFRSALSALEPFDLDASSVIRTRMYLSHARDAEEVGRAHRELFEAVRPAATMVVVAGFADSRVLVEVEIEAYRGDARGVRAADGGTGGDGGADGDGGTGDADGGGTDDGTGTGTAEGAGA